MDLESKFIYIFFEGTSSPDYINIKNFNNHNNKWWIEITDLKPCKYGMNCKLKTHSINKCPKHDDNYNFKDDIHWHVNGNWTIKKNKY